MGLGCVVVGWLCGDRWGWVSVGGGDGDGDGDEWVAKMAMGRVPPSPQLLPQQPPPSPQPQQPPPSPQLLP